MDSRVIGIAAVVFLVQFTLQVIALVQLVRTPAERVTIGGRKWAWALIIVLGEILGPILWFTLGRSQVTSATGGKVADESQRESAVDALYGSPKE